MVQSNDSLLQRRNDAVAKSFYRKLRREGFSHEQIIQLSSTLLDLVTAELRDAPAPPQAR